MFKFSPVLSAGSQASKSASLSFQPLCNIRSLSKQLALKRSEHIRDCVDVLSLDASATRLVVQHPKREIAREKKLGAGREQQSE